MGVYLFGASKENLDEALELLEIYPDTYMNVGGLRQIIGQLKAEG
jgi:predicted metal-dependent hydrolase